jgi:hypothetical protein
VCGQGHARRRPRVVAMPVIQARCIMGLGTYQHFFSIVEIRPTSNAP